jgi:hypothetical protein
MTDQSLRVRATKMVFYGGMRIRPGVTFTLTDPAHFSASSMARVPPETPDTLAAAVEASPKQRGEGGVTLKQKRAHVKTAPGVIDPDPGI